MSTCDSECQECKTYDRISKADHQANLAAALDAAKEKINCYNEGYISADERAQLCSSLMANCAACSGAGTKCVNEMYANGWYIYNKAICQAGTAAQAAQAPAVVGKDIMLYTNYDECTDELRSEQCSVNPIMCLDNYNENLYSKNSIKLDSTNKTMTLTNKDNTFSTVWTCQGPNETNFLPKVSKTTTFLTDPDLTNPVPKPVTDKTHVCPSGGDPNAQVENTECNAFSDPMLFQANITVNGGICEGNEDSLFKRSQSGGTGVYSTSLTKSPMFIGIVTGQNDTFLVMQVKANAYRAYQCYQRSPTADSVRKGVTAYSSEQELLKKNKGIQMCPYHARDSKRARCYVTLDYISAISGLNPSYVIDPEVVCGNGSYITAEDWPFPS